jgi:putative transposase
MSRYNPKIHNRRSIRLKGYDYRKEGLYFITLVVHDRKQLFGRVINGKVQLNDAGEMIEREWMALKKRFEMIQLHEFIVMPDHFHAILEIIPDATVGSTLVVDPNDKMVDPNDKMVDPNDKMVDPNDKMVDPNDKMVDPNDKMVDPNDKMVDPNDKMVDPNDKMVDPNDKMVDPNDKMVDPNDKMVDPNDKMVDPNINDIGRPQGSPQTSPQTLPSTGESRPRLGDIIMAFKSITTVAYIQGVKNNNWQRFNRRLWQRNYWEHIIRNRNSFHRISSYIKNNPLNW